MDDGEPRTRRNRAWKSDFCSCGNKLIEHTTELRIVLTYVGRGVSRVTARTNTLARNERKRHGMRQASPSAPAQRNEAKERQRD